MLDFLILIEEDEKADKKLEDYKATLLQSFPSLKLYEKLYHHAGEDKFQEIIETEPTHEDIADIVKMLDGSFSADSGEF